MSRSKWSQEEDQVLISKYTTMDPSECAKLMGRTIGSVKNRAHKLGVKNSKYWILEDIEFLKENYNSLGPKDCSFILNKSYDSVKDKASSLGLKAPFHWQTGEIDYLKENYAKVGLKGCHAHLNRSLESIKLKASELKIKAPGVWDHLSNRELLDLVRRHRLVNEFMYKEELPDPKVLLRRFNKSSWREILELAGVPQNGYRPDDGATFYILKFQDTDSVYFYKYGYTQNTLKIRYKHRKDFEVMYQKETSMIEALALEKQMKDSTKKYRPKDIRFYNTGKGHGGYTECFTDYTSKPGWVDRG